MVDTKKMSDEEYYEFLNHNDELHTYEKHRHQLNQEYLREQQEYFDKLKKSK